MVWLKSSDYEFGILKASGLHAMPLSETVDSQSVGWKFKSQFEVSFSSKASDANITKFVLFVENSTRAYSWLLPEFNPFATSELWRQMSELILFLSESLTNVVNFQTPAFDTLWTSQTGGVFTLTCGLSDWKKLKTSCPLVEMCVVPNLCNNH